MFNTSYQCGSIFLTRKKHYSRPSEWRRLSSSNASGVWHLLHLTHGFWTEHVLSQLGFWTEHVLSEPGFWTEHVHSEPGLWTEHVLLEPGFRTEHVLSEPGFRTEYVPQSSGSGWSTFLQSPERWPFRRDRHRRRQAFCAASPVINSQSSDTKLTSCGESWRRRSPLFDACLPATDDASWGSVSLTTSLLTNLTRRRWHLPTTGQWTWPALPFT